MINTKMAILCGHPVDAISLRSNSMIIVSMNDFDIKVTQISCWMLIWMWSLTIKIINTHEPKN